VRNPWGYGEWKGDWSDFSPLWTLKAKEAFQPSLNPDDGAFWISWEDFLAYFANVTVCYCRRDWVDARLGVDMSFDFEKKELTTPTVRLIVPKGGKWEWIGAYQQDEREQDAPKNMDLCVFVLKEVEGGREPIAFLGMENSRHSFECFGADSRHYSDNLEEGSYLLVPFTTACHWDAKAGGTRAIALSVHCHSTSSRIGMKVAGAMGRAEIDEMLLDFTMKFGEEKKWQALSRKHLRVGQLDLYGGVNTSDDQVMIFSMKGDLDNIQNALGYPDLGAGCAFEVNPQSRCIFGVQAMINPKDPGSSAYKFGLKTKAYKPE